MKRSIILTALLVLNLSFAVAQAKNSRKEYTAVDNHTYKKGETLVFGVPARGTQYENIFINDIITTGDYISMFTGGTIEEKILELQEGKKNLVTTVLDGNESCASMTVEDIKEILGIAIS